MRRLSPLLLLGALAACGEPTSLTPGAEEQPAATSAVMASRTIQDRYIVVFRPGVSPGDVTVAGTTARALGARVHHTYARTIRGFAATLSPEALEALRGDPQVAYIEPDNMVYPTQTQSNPPWGLDRIDQRNLPLNFLYGAGVTGAGVTVYIIDTGILPTHSEFGGRASIGLDATGGNGIDCNGHGTHVAGTIGGATYGVAKAATLVAVRVFGCSGGAATSTIIAAVDWVTANAVLPAVTNMSLGGGASTAMDDAVKASIAAGITYVVSAGNAASNACLNSPARVPEAITVGSSTISDARSSFSNHGTCVDIFAPGSGILSAWYTGTSASASISGTSMASPHVAGVAARWLQTHQGASPASVTNQIINSATSNRLSQLPFGSPNLLLFSRLTVESGPRMSLDKSALSFLVLEPSRELMLHAAAPSERARFTVRASGSGLRKSGTTVNPADVDPMASSQQNLVLTNTGNAPLDWSVTDNAGWLDVSPASGNLAAGASVALQVTADASLMTAGVHNGTIRIGSTNALNGPLFATVQLSVMAGSDLESGVPLTGLWDTFQASRFYRINVSPGATELVVDISGGTGDADLYLRPGAPPTLSTWTCRPWFNGNFETCTILNPTPGDWWIMLYAFAGYSDVSLVATTTVAAPGTPTGLAAAAVGVGRIDVSWNDGADESSYRLASRLRNLNGTWGPWTNIVPDLGMDVTAHSHTGLLSGRRYQYRLRACNGGGCGPWTSSVAATAN